MSTRRMQRINELIRREVCFMLHREVKDHRIGFTTVMECKVTPDLKEARVYVSVLGDKKTKKETMAGLESAAPYMQGQIGRVANLRFTPRLIFMLDESTEKAARIDELIKKIKRDEIENME